MKDIVPVWAPEGGSRRLPVRWSAALVLLFLPQLLCARQDTHQSSATVSSDNREPKTCGLHYGFDGLSSSLDLPTSVACTRADGLFPASALSFFSHLLYLPLSLCRWSTSQSASCYVGESTFQQGLRSASGRSRRECVHLHNDTRSGSALHILSSPYPSLVPASATLVRIRGGHAQRMKHAAASGALEPGGGSPEVEEENPEDEDTVLTQEDQAGEDECAPQAAIQTMLEAEFAGDPSSSMTAAAPWLKLKAALMKRMANKEVCRTSHGSEEVCRVAPPEESSGSESSNGGLPCGGQAYERVIERFLDERNCMTAMAMSHTLSQGWLGLQHTKEAGNGATGALSLTAQPSGDTAEHSLALASRGGLLGVLSKQYQQVIDSGVLDRSLSSIYADASQLLDDFRQAATEGLNAFNSLDIRDALQLRRLQQVAMLCGLGEGRRADLGSSVLSGDASVIVRVNTGGHDQATVKAFIDAVAQFAKFVQALLEDGGFADRAADIHKQFYHFRFEKMQLMMQEMEPSTVIHTRNTLINALPLEKHKSHKKKQKTHPSSEDRGASGSEDISSSSSDKSAEEASFSQLSSTESTTSFLPGMLLQFLAEQRDAFIHELESFHSGRSVTGVDRQPSKSFLQQRSAMESLQPLPPSLSYSESPVATSSQQFSPVYGAVMPVQSTATTAAVPQVVPLSQASLAGSNTQPLMSAMQQPGGNTGQGSTSGAFVWGTAPGTLTQALPASSVGTNSMQQQLQQQPQQQTLQQPQPQQQQPPQQQQQPQQQQPQQLSMQGAVSQASQAAPQLQQTQPQFSAVPGQSGGVPSPQLTQQQGASPQQQQLGQPQQLQVNTPTLPQQPSGLQGGFVRPISQGEQQQQQGREEAQPSTEGSNEGSVPGGDRSQQRHPVTGPEHGEPSSEAFTQKGVPLKKKLEAVMSRLRMFKMEDEKLLFEPDEPLVDKIIRSGYLEMSDRVVTAWGSLLPQAAATTSAELLTVLLPIPEVDLAMFYNRTLHDDGRVTEGYEGSLPLDDRMIGERFSRFIDESYRQCWRLFFARNDNLVGEASATPPQSPPQQQGNTGVAPLSGMSALQLNGNVHARLSLAAEVEELTNSSAASSGRDGAAAGVAGGAAAGTQVQLQQHEGADSSKIETPGKESSSAAAASTTLLNAPLHLHGDLAALAEVHQHQSLHQAASSGQEARRVAVTFVESTDGLNVAEEQANFVNEAVVNAKTVQALSGATSKFRLTALPAAVSAVLVLLFSNVFAGH